MKKSTEREAKSLQQSYERNKTLLKHQVGSFQSDEVQRSITRNCRSSPSVHLACYSIITYPVPSSELSKILRIHKYRRDNINPDFAFDVRIYSRQSKFKQNIRCQKGKYQKFGMESHKIWHRENQDVGHPSGKSTQTLNGNCNRIL